VSDFRNRVTSKDFVCVSKKGYDHLQAFSIHANILQDEDDLISDVNICTPTKQVSLSLQLLILSLYHLSVLILAC